MQLKRTNEHRDARSPEPKRKTKSVSKDRATDIDEATVRFTALGMDFLTNGLVRCQELHVLGREDVVQVSLRCLLQRT